MVELSSTRRRQDRFLDPRYACFALYLAIVLLLPREIVVVIALGTGLAAAASGIFPASASAGKLLVALTVVALLRANIADAPASVQVAGGLAVGAGLLPFALRPLSRGSGFPFLHAFGLMGATYVVITVAFSKETGVLAVPLQMEDRARGLLLFATFLTAAAVVDSVVARHGRAPIVDRPGEVDALRAMSLIILGYLGSAAIAVLHTGAQLGTVTNLVEVSRTVGFVALLLAYWRGTIAGRWIVVAGALAAFEVVIGIGSTELYSRMSTPLACLALALALRRHVPWRLLLVVAFAALVVNSVKGDFRVAEKSGPQIARGADLIGTAIVVGSTDEHRLSRSAHRFGYSVADHLGFVSKYVPKSKPYWNKATYRFLPYVVIPRVLLPWKPRSVSVQDYGREYGLLSPNDFTTSPNLSVPTEAYVNFGFLGLVVAGVVVGLLTGLLARFVDRDRLAMLVLGAVVARQLLAGIESDSVVMIGFLPLLVPVAAVLARWCVRDR